MFLETSLCRSLTVALSETGPVSQGPCVPRAGKTQVQTGTASRWARERPRGQTLSQ